MIKTTMLLITDQKAFPDNVNNVNIERYMRRIANERMIAGVVTDCKILIIPYPCNEMDISVFVREILRKYIINSIEIVYPDMSIPADDIKSKILSIISIHSPSIFNYYDEINVKIESIKPSDIEHHPNSSTRRKVSAIHSVQKPDNLANVISDVINEKSSDEKKPKELIALIGSRKFIDVFNDVANKLSSEGNIVFTPDIFSEDTEKLHWKTIKAYEDLYNFKIKLSSKVIVINKDGYIGKDTQREIDYANRLGKVIEYYEPVTKSNKNPIKSFKNDIKGCENEKLIPAAVNFVESSYKYMRPWAEITQEMVNGEISSSLEKIFKDNNINELIKRPIDELTPLEMMIVFHKKIMEHPDRYNIKDVMK